MDGEKQKIIAKRARRFRIHRLVNFVLLAVGVPAIAIAITGYSSVWEVIFSFGFCALLAWTLYWTNWVNSVIFAVGVPVFVIVIMGYRSVWNVILIFGFCGFVVWSAWFWLWVKKRIYEMSDEDKK
jgi:hypothetical protein